MLEKVRADTWVRKIVDDEKPLSDLPDQGERKWVDISVTGTPTGYGIDNGNLVHKGKGKGGWVGMWSFPPSSPI